MKRFKLFAFLILLAVSMVASAFTSFAVEEEKDYSIFDCWWDADTDGVAKAAWDKPASSTTYKVRLYRGSKVVVDWKSVSGTSYNFTSAIAKNGTGSYFFSVYPVKGDGDYMVTSDELEVDSEMLKALKGTEKAAADERAYEAASDGWHSYPNNTWTYGKGNNTLAKNQWLDIDGATYYFNSKGYMVTGWQKIGNAYYYFDKKDGFLWRNATTPDGYYVNGDGVWIDGSGNVGAVASSTGTVSVTITESGADGTIRSAAVTGVGGANLVSWNFATDPSTWQINYPVELTVVVSPKSGAKFTSSTKYTCNLGSVKSATGTDQVTLKIAYQPRMKLLAPATVYMGDDESVRWTAVSNAKSYKVKIYDGSSLQKTKLVVTNHCDISEYCDEEEYPDINVVVTALGTSNGASSNYLESEPAKLGSVTDTYVNDTGVSGTFVKTSQGLSYRNGNGDRATGWQAIGNYWYLFGNDYIAKTGWYQDTDGCWYYFAGDGKMMTGNVNDGGATYFMNDGSNEDFPYGAWVH